MNGSLFQYRHSLTFRLSSHYQYQITQRKNKENRINTKYSSIYAFFCFGEDKWRNCLYVSTPNLSISQIILKSAP